MSNYLYRESLKIFNLDNNKKKIIAEEQKKRSLAQKRWSPNNNNNRLAEYFGTINIIIFFVHTIEVDLIEFFYQPFLSFVSRGHRPRWN